MPKFVENVTKGLYISDPNQLKLDMKLWLVGQGGISNVNKPYYLGIVAGIHKTVSDYHFLEMEEYPNQFVVQYIVDDKVILSDRSMLDSHILPQKYNNWYVCDSEEKAKKIYDYILEVWNSDTSYEKSRKEFEDRSHFLFRDYF